MYLSGGSREYLISPSQSSSLLSFSSSCSPLSLFFSTSPSLGLWTGPWFGGWLWLPLSEGVFRWILWREGRYPLRTVNRFDCDYFATRFHFRASLLFFPLSSSFFPSISLVWQQSVLIISSLIYPGRIQRGILSWWNRLDPVLTAKCTRWGWEEEESRGVLIVVRMECVCTFMSLHCVTFIYVQLVCMFYFDLLFN